MSQLLTGFSGFLGNVIYTELKKQGAVLTVSRTKASINIDLSRQIPSLPAVDLVVHCAGKAHSVPRTALEKQSFFDVNLTGTANLLTGLSHSGSLPKSFVFVSTVAVYGCQSGSNINEDHPLNADDPYGKSKVMAERLVMDWCLTNGVICSILRLPLIIGNNPPGNLGAMISAIKKGYYFNIAGGKARKSMVLASDVAKLIPNVAAVGGIYNLTDGYHPSFAELSGIMAKQLARRSPYQIPCWLAKAIASFGNLLGDWAPVNTNKLIKITSDLTFDDNKARKFLGWKPGSVLLNINVK